MILQWAYRQSVKRVFNVSTILIHDIPQTTSPFTDAVINEAIIVRATPAQSFALNDQRRQTSAGPQIA